MKLDIVHPAITKTNPLHATLTGLLCLLMVFSGFSHGQQKAAGTTQNTNRLYSGNLLQAPTFQPLNAWKVPPQIKPTVRKDRHKGMPILDLPAAAEGKPYIFYQNFPAVQDLEAGDYIHEEIYLRLNGGGSADLRIVYQREIGGKKENIIETTQLISAEQKAKWHKLSLDSLCTDEKLSNLISIAFVVRVQASGKHTVSIASPRAWVFRAI